MSDLRLMTVIVTTIQVMMPLLPLRERSVLPIVMVTLIIRTIHRRPKELWVRQIGVIDPDAY
jgi:hypothetical protein